MSARGLALIDIVVALGIVLVLGALAIPTFVGLMTRTSMDEGAGRIESIASICRAEAMRRGCLVELAFRVDETNHVVLLGRRRDGIPADAASGEGKVEGGFENETDDGHWPAFLVEPLPARIEFVLENPVQHEPEEGEEETPAAKSGVIAIFLPSGAATGGARSWLVRAKGAGEGVIKVNAWTGSVRVGARAAGESSTAPREPEPEQGGDEPEVEMPPTLPAGGVAP